LCSDGTTWTTDKDGPVMGLLAVEMSVRTGRDPGEHYALLTRDLGEPTYSRVDAPATVEQKRALGRLTAADVVITELAGDAVKAVLTAAPGDGQSIGGIKVVTDNGWFAARPSGTEAVYKLYTESFRGPDHLRRIQEEAQAVVSKALGRAGE
jgi:phosphoglucomutase